MTHLEPQEAERVDIDKTFFLPVLDLNNFVAFSDILERH